MWVKRPTGDLSALVMVMAYYLTTSSYHLNQYWLIISKVQLHSSEDNSQKLPHPSITKIWAHFMCHHELWPTSASHPFSLNSSLGFAGGKTLPAPTFLCFVFNIFFLEVNLGLQIVCYLCSLHKKTFLATSPVGLVTDQAHLSETKCTSPIGLVASNIH